jgi:enamine deaminase RidA (YjgF/YER057c/UK114 family)
MRSLLRGSEHASLRLAVAIAVGGIDRSGVALLGSRRSNIQRERGVMSIKRSKVGARMSQCVVHGDTVYLAGQVADDPNTDVAGQTKQILAKIDGLLAEAGSDKSKLLSATVWLSDIRAFDEMNKVWDAWVSPGNTPARACGEAKLASSNLMVEIGIVAAR